MRAVIVLSDILTAYGHGVDVCWDGIMSGKTAVLKIDRFDISAFHADRAALVSGLNYHQGRSLVMQMLQKLKDRMPGPVPEDAKLLVASTKGEIDLLEKSLLEKTGDPEGSILANLPEKISGLFGLKDKGTVISAACASSAAAVARAASMVQNDFSDCILVVGCDSITEFVYSGFSSLMALDKFSARPFDKNREGLSLGEAAGYVLIMSYERAKKEDREIMGEVLGWGLSDDANHMTGPSRTGSGLARAIKKALDTARLNTDDIGCISAHGTGTLYNDAMELTAFNDVFGSSKKPVYSVKGGLGHTMGAAGLIELALLLRTLKESTVPPTVNLKDIDEQADGWARSTYYELKGRYSGLLTNAGFSGINGALIVA